MNIIEGIQCGEDAVLAVEHGVQGIIVSNHGGRQLDCARSAIEILPEVMAALKARGYENKVSRLMITSPEWVFFFF